MTAISKAWVAIADGAVDPDSPIDSTLMTGLRDNDIHLREWIGASYEAGAVQDHNHDGVNSAPIAGEVGHVEWWPGLALPSGTSAVWDWCDGNTISRTTYPTYKNVVMKEATVTLTIASPCVVTWTAHGLRDNLPVRFFTTGALPTGITAGSHGGPGTGTEYYVKVVNADTFNISATPGGANINTSGTQSGTQTCTCAPHGDGDGSTTVHKPDMRGRVPIGRDDMGGTAANRITSGGSGISGNVLGRSGGAETVTLSTTTMPSHNHPGSTTPSNQGAINTGTNKIQGINVQNGTGTDINITTTVASQGSGSAHQNTQPSLVCDWIIRIA